VRVTVCVVVILLGFAVPSAWIESGYSGAVYPWIQAALVPAFGWTRVPIMGACLLLLPLAIVVYAARRWRRARREDIGVAAITIGGTFRTLRTVLYVYTVFLVLWGLGYRREPIEARWRLGDELPTYEQVREVQERILAVIHADCPTGDAASEAEEERAMRAIVDAELLLVAELDGWTPTPTRTKHPPAGALMTVGIFGIVSPFTLEANVDAALPLPFRLGISGHELAHIFGYCGEADANLVSFVAGLRTANPLARYATAMTMLRYTGSRKHVEDSRWLYANLPERAKDDLAALRAALDGHRIAPLADFTHAMNDRYLKTQGVTLGVDDYSRGFTLFVRAWTRGLVALPAPYKRKK
jgi:Protein of unknown function (DUF3810)